MYMLRIYTSTLVLLTSKQFQNPGKQCLAELERRTTSKPRNILELSFQIIHSVENCVLPKMESKEV